MFPLSHKTLIDKLVYSYMVLHAGTLYSPHHIYFAGIYVLHFVTYTNTPHSFSVVVACALII